MEDPIKSACSTSENWMRQSNVIARNIELGGHDHIASLIGWGQEDLHSGLPEEC